MIYYQTRPEPDIGLSFFCWCALTILLALGCVIDEIQRPSSDANGNFEVGDAFKLSVLKPRSLKGFAESVGKEKADAFKLCLEILESFGGKVPDEHRDDLSRDTCLKGKTLEGDPKPVSTGRNARCREKTEEEKAREAAEKAREAARLADEHICKGWETTRAECHDLKTVATPAQWRSVYTLLHGAAPSSTAHFLPEYWAITTLVLPCAIFHLVRGCAQWIVCYLGVDPKWVLIFSVVPIVLGLGCWLCGLERLWRGAGVGLNILRPGASAAYNMVASRLPW